MANRAKICGTITALVMVLAGCAPAQQQLVQTRPAAQAMPWNQTATLYLKAPTAGKVPFFGEISYDDAGVAGGNILYPGGNAGMFLASVLAHAVTVEAVKSQKEKDIQKRADEVLKPYSPVIDAFASTALIDAALDPSRSPASSPTLMRYLPETQEDGWIISSVPVFFLTQDQTALILRNTITVSARHDPGKVVYKNAIEYISDSHAGADPLRYWSADDGKALRETSADIFARSIALMLRDSWGELPKNSGQNRTFRYQRAERKFYERGELLAIDCQRATMRTLRGWVKSMPIRAEDYQDLLADDCAASSTTSNDATIAAQDGVGS